MSSPIHHAEDLDAALVYAPPWAREPAPPLVGPPVEQLASEPLPVRRALRVGRGFSGDRAMQELQRKLALNPERVPEPPLDDARSWWPLMLRLCVVGGVAALAAWGMVLLPGAHKAGNETMAADLAASPSQPPIAVNRVRVVHIQPATATPPLLHEEFARASDPPQHAEAPAVLPEPAAPQSAKPQTAILPQSTAPSQSDSNTAAIDDDEIATLVKRGKDFVMNGDFASARLLLRRAALAGSAEAALALGATFDPIIIARLGAVGAESDIARARKWYQKAAEAGSQAASQQLAKLVQPQQ